MSYLTRDNILDIIYSYGTEMHHRADPNYWSYEDHYRTEKYQKAYEEARVAWSEIRRGEDPVPVLHRLNRSSNSGSFRLALFALEGKFERPLDEITGPNPVVNSFWVTYKGDLFFVARGDRWNRASVRRLANRFLPEDQRKLEVSREIADALPKPVPTAKDALAS